MWFFYQQGTAAGTGSSIRTIKTISKKQGGAAAPPLHKKSRPVSRVLSWTVIHLGYASPHTSCDLPGDNAGRANAPLFGLAPDGVYPATDVATSAVRSYHTISPLPTDPKIRRRYIFCGTFHRLTPPRCYLASRPVEPGLSSIPKGTATIQPTPGHTILDTEHPIQEQKNQPANNILTLLQVSN